MSYAFLACAFVLNAAANILLKFAAQAGFSFETLVQGELGRGHLLAAVAAVLFAGNLAAYLIALRTIPLSVGYPVMIGMTFVITTGAALALGERMNLLEAVGLAAILAGIFLVVYATA